MTARPICAGPARWMCHATALGHLCGYPQIEATPPSPGVAKVAEGVDRSPGRASATNQKARAMKKYSTYICSDGDPNEQCSYVSYGGYFDARRKRQPLHRHDDQQIGQWPQWAHGPAEKCKHVKAER